MLLDSPITLAPGSSKGIYVHSGKQNTFYSLIVVNRTHSVHSCMWSPALMYTITSAIWDFVYFVFCFWLFLSLLYMMNQRHCVWWPAPIFKFDMIWCDLRFFYFVVFLVAALPGNSACLKIWYDLMRFEILFIFFFVAALPGDSAIVYDDQRHANSHKSLFLTVLYTFKLCPSRCCTRTTVYACVTYVHICASRTRIKVCPCGFLNCF